jgi:hypothetical protein
MVDHMSCTLTPPCSPCCFDAAMVDDGDALGVVLLIVMGDCDN